MWTHASAIAPEPEHDDERFDADVDPWSSGYIVFSLGASFDEVPLETH